MDIGRVKCQDCGWTGSKAELVRVNFTMGDPQPCCPSCGGDRMEDEQPLNVMK